KSKQNRPPLFSRFVRLGICCCGLHRSRRTARILRRRLALPPLSPFVERRHDRLNVRRDAREIPGPISGYPVFALRDSVPVPIAAHAVVRRAHCVDRYEPIALI
ncbi:MAG TPA: hypothetical protein VNM70_20670, partial [Burkholderiales bacterium]|nr:hypothetical protein [Burkholderiales bacterium]